MSDTLNNAVKELVNESTARKTCMDLLECSRELRSCTPQNIYFAARAMIGTLDSQPEGNAFMVQKLRRDPGCGYPVKESISAKEAAYRLLDALNDDIEELTSLVEFTAYRTDSAIISIVGMYAGTDGLDQSDGEHDEAYNKAYNNLWNYAWVMLCWGFPQEEITRLLEMANGFFGFDYSFACSPYILSDDVFDELKGDLSCYEAARDTRFDDLLNRVVSAYKAENATKD